MEGKETDVIMLPEVVPELTSEGNPSSDHSTELAQVSKMDFQTLSIDPVASLKMEQTVSNKLLHHCLPITSLKLLDGMVLVASEGPSILIKMAYRDSQPFQRFQLFPSQLVISGMEFEESPVRECGDNPSDTSKVPDKSYDNLYIGYVWAGSVSRLIRVTRSVKHGLKLLDYTGSESFVGETCSFDFIPVAAKWLEGGNYLALLSVLNYVVIFQRTERQGSPGAFTNIQEVSRIKCSKSETLFSGRIWANCKNKIRIFSGTVFNGIIVWDVVGGEAVIKHELKCHDGIIFSLEYYEDRKLLLSTSDDRTVGVWQFSSGEGEGNESVSLLHRLYGHDARVWRALVVHGYVLSVGESSEVRVNILKDGREHKTWKAHNGSPIFTCAYDEDLEILYSAGNDGSIRKWPKWWYQVKPRVLPYDVIPFDSEKDDKSRIQGSGRWSENKDFPKHVVLLDINHVLVSMESGRVLGISWEGKQYDLLYDSRCEGYQIIRISPDHKVLAVAGNDGHFYTAQISFSENQASKRNILFAKKIFMTKISWNIITMIWLDPSRLLIICLNKAIALLLKETEAGERSDVQFIQTFDLNLKKPGIPTAVEILGKYVVLGDEIGSLHLLRYHKTNEVIQKLENVHKDGCTSLLYHESKLYSCGRDGKVKCFYIQVDSEDDMKVDFVSLCSFSMNFDWVTGVYANMGQMLCCGFLKEDFIVHSLTEKRNLLKVPCGGGGNRKWNFKYGHGETGSRNASFTFIKDKEVLYTFLPMDGYIMNTMKDGLHCRTINCAIHLQSSVEKIDYISGSEDGSLKWFQWNKKNQSILSGECMENHVSSIRSVWKITDASNQTFLFTGGGRSQLCIYKMDMANQRLEPLKEIILVKTTFKQTEGDVRIMDIVVTDRGNNELWCFSACSDGIVRLLYFNTKTFKFKITGLLNGNSHAVMRINLLKSEPSNGVVQIVGVTSNGYFMLWTWHEDNIKQEIGSTSLPERSTEYHVLLRRTAFLSMRAYLDSVEQDPHVENYSVVCGGDDCSVSLWSLNITKENESVKYAINEKWTQDYCQRGAVVGVEIIDNFIYTLSNDQIVAIWDASGKLVTKVYAGVSDCQGFVVSSGTNCVMCFGKGIAWVPIIQNSNPSLMDS